MLSHMHQISTFQVLTAKPNHSTAMAPAEVGVKTIQLQEGDTSKNTMIGTELDDK